MEMGSLWIWEPGSEKSQERNYFNITTAEAINHCEINILYKHKVKKYSPTYSFYAIYVFNLFKSVTHQMQTQN